MAVNFALQSRTILIVPHQNGEAALRLSRWDFSIVTRVTMTAGTGDGAGVHFIRRAIVLARNLSI